MISKVNRNNGYVRQHAWEVGNIYNNLLAMENFIINITSLNE